MASELKVRDIQRLEAVDWGESHFDGLVTSRSFPRRDMLRLMRMGLVQSIGVACICDDDGFTVMPERYREGFVLTELGRKILVEHWNACEAAPSGGSTHG